MTLIVVDALLPDAATVMVAWPALIPVTTPAGETTATSVSELLQVKLKLAGAPFASVAAAVSAV